MQACKLGATASLHMMQAKWHPAGRRRVTGLDHRSKPLDGEC